MGRPISCPRLNPLLPQQPSLHQSSSYLTSQIFNMMSCCISKEKRAGLVLKPPELTSRNTPKHFSYSLWISRQVPCVQVSCPARQLLAVRATTEGAPRPSLTCEPGRLLRPPPGRTILPLHPSSFRARSRSPPSGSILPQHCCQALPGHAVMGSPSPARL